MAYTWVFVRDSSRRHALFNDYFPTALAHILLQYPYPDAPVQYRVIMDPYGKQVQIGVFATLRKAKAVAEALALMYLEVQ